MEGHRGRSDDNIKQFEMLYTCARRETLTNQRDAETILLTVSHLLILCDRRYDWLLRDIIRGNITKVNVTRQISLSLFAQHDGWHNLNLLGMM